MQQWHDGAARTAQRWADQCRFLTHDSSESRAVSNFGQCGQNIFVSTHKMPWYVLYMCAFIYLQTFIRIYFELV